MLTHGRVPSLVLTAQDLLDYRHQTVGVDSWEFDIFQYASSVPRPLVGMVMVLMDKLGLLTCPGLPQSSGAAVEVPWDIAVNFFEVR
jgi:hypothetical protein